MGQLSQTDPKAVAHHNKFTTGDHLTLHQQVNGLVHALLQRNDLMNLSVQELPNGHHGGANTDLHLGLDLVQGVQILNDRRCIAA